MPAKIGGQTVKEFGGKKGVVGFMVTAPRYKPVHDNAFIKTYKPVLDDACFRAFDTMEVKHKECFIPNTINSYNLQGVSKYAREAAECIFVRGCTEGVNLVASSYGRRFINEGDEILVTQMEHHSNIVPWQAIAEERGARVRMVPINIRGEVIIEEYEALLNERTRMVAVSHVSNSLGTVNPIKEMTATAHKFGVPVCVDAAQSVPHFPVDVQDLDADFFVFSGHKMFAPTGSGVAYGKREWLDKMPPYQTGGGMIRTVSFEKTTYAPIPEKFEAGTPAIAAAIARADPVYRAQADTPILNCRGIAHGWRR